jgi:hypothetical protein
VRVAGDGAANRPHEERGFFFCAFYFVFSSCFYNLVEGKTCSPLYERIWPAGRLTEPGGCCVAESFGAFRVFRSPLASCRYFFSSLSFFLSFSFFLQVMVVVCFGIEGF